LVQLGEFRRLDASGMVAGWRERESLEDHKYPVNDGFITML